MKMRYNYTYVVSRLEKLCTISLFSLKIVFSKFVYIAISIVVFVFFWVIFNVFEQTLFFFPILTFYLTDDAIIGFILNNITSALMGLLISLDVYIFRNFYNKLDKLAFSSSILGVATSTCASCSSIGFLVISTFGAFGIVVTDFISNYQIPLRIFSIIIILWALIAAFSKITKACNLSKKLY
jgi:hypothetical protein